MAAITEQGTLVNGTPGTPLAVNIFSAITTLTDGTVLLTYRAGSTKDCDDEAIYLRRSTDAGRTWGPPLPMVTPKVHGKRGSLRVCYLTEIPSRSLLAAAMWIDHETYPGKPLFNAETEGCLPMEIVLAESSDHGKTWSPWRVVAMPEEIGPPSLTSPLLRLADGTLAMSIETNKHYLDASKWYQRVVFFHSEDQGKSWTVPTVAGRDPTARIFNWDLRCCVAPDGRIATFAWTYDSDAKKYLNIHRRVSSDGGRTWTEPKDLGITDQAGHPAVLPDGRIVLPWVDRFNTRSIKVRVARDAGSPFPEDTERVIYAHKQVGGRKDLGSTADTLTDMGLWTFGLPYAEILPDGDVMVVYYAGRQQQMDVRYARLKVG